jgi:hypothetical protein
MRRIGSLLSLAALGMLAYTTLVGVPGPTPPSNEPILLRDVSLATPRMAAQFDAKWWATPVETLRERERAKDATARAWAIQGDDRIRLVVLNDTRRQIRDGTFRPLHVVLLVNNPKGTTGISLWDSFYSDDRDTPVQLQVDGHRVTVVARSSRECRSESLLIDAADATATLIPGSGGC